MISLTFNDFLLPVVLLYLFFLCHEFAFHRRCFTCSSRMLLTFPFFPFNSFYLLFHGFLSFFRFYFVIILVPFSVKQYQFLYFFWIIMFFHFFPFKIDDLLGMITRFVHQIADYWRLCKKYSTRMNVFIALLYYIKRLSSFLLSFYEFQQIMKLFHLSFLFLWFF